MQFFGFVLLLLFCMSLEFVASEEERRELKVTLFEEKVRRERICRLKVRDDSEKSCQDRDGLLVLK